MYVKEELNEFVENMMQKAYEKYQSSPAAENERRYFEETDIFLQDSLLEEQWQDVQEWMGERLLAENRFQRWLYEKGMTDSIQLLQYLKII